MIDTDIREFLNDRTSGASSLAKKELKIIKKLLSTEKSEKEIKEFIQKASQKFPEMAPIKKIEFFFSKNQINKENFKELSEKFSDEKFIQNSKFLFSNKKNILTFSNSSSILKVLLNYNNKINKVYCCHSLPLGEGKVLHENLIEKSIDSKLIEDMEFAKYYNKIDFIILGADAIGEKYFINKVGTNIIAILANHFHIPVYVVSSNIKYFNESEFSKLQTGEYFEKVDNKYITKFIA